MEPQWTSITTSFQGSPWLIDVRSRPFDVSPYGLLGAVGNVRDWCANGYDRLPPNDQRVDPVPEPSKSDLRMIRGGSFTSTDRVARPCCRFASDPQSLHLAVGFRLAYPVGPITR